MINRLKTVFNAEHGLRSATVLLAITLFLSNALGLLRNILLSSHATSLTQLDTYYAAFRLPDLVFNLLVLGAIASAFIPVYAQIAKDRGQIKAVVMANTLLGTMVASVTVTLILLWILMPALVPLLVPKFTLAQQTETVTLARIMLLSPFFFCFSYVSGAILNAHKRFFAYSIAPLIYNLAIITGAFFLPTFGVRAVAWSVVFGALLHFLIQVPSLYSTGFHFHPKVNFYHKEVRQVILLMIPRTMSLGITQLVLVGFTVIASMLSPGALTIFNLTNDFQTTPAILFGASLATALFPTLAESVAEDTTERYQHYLHRTLRITLFLLIPTTIIIFLLRAQIMRLYIGLGHNTSWGDTIRAINTLAWFSLSFVAQALVFLLARAFYALQDTKRPMYASVVSAAVTLILGIILIQTPMFGKSTLSNVAAMAAAYSIGMWIQATLLFVWLPPKWRGNLELVWTRIVPIGSISIASGFATWLTLRVVGNGLHLSPFVSVTVIGISTHTVIGLLIQGALSAIVGALVYFGLARSLKLEELNWALSWRKSVQAEIK